MWAKRAAFAGSGAWDDDGLYPALRHDGLTLHAIWNKAEDCREQSCKVTYAFPSSIAARKRHWIIIRGHHQLTYDTSPISNPRRSATASITGIK